MLSALTRVFSCNSRWMLSSGPGCGFRKSYQLSEPTDQKTLGRLRPVGIVLGRWRGGQPMLAHQPSQTLLLSSSLAYRAPVPCLGISEIVLHGPRNIAGSRETTRRGSLAHFASLSAENFSKALVQSPSKLVVELQQSLSEPWYPTEDCRG